MSDNRESESHKQQRYAQVSGRLLKNSALMAVCRVITVSLSLVAVPIIVGNLGIAGYGTWESIMAVSGLSSILLVPLGGTLLWKISAAYGVSNLQEVRRLVRLGVGASVLLFLVIFPLSWLFRQQTVQLFNVPTEFEGPAAGILPCMVGMVILGGVNDTIGALISAFQRAGMTTLIQSIGIIVNTSVVIAFLCLKWGLWSLLIGKICGFLITLSGLYAMARRYCEGLTLVPALPNRTDAKEMSGYAGLMLIGSASAALRGHTDKIILGTVASQTLVGFYAIGARLASLIMEVSNFFYVPTITAVGALHAGGDWEGIKRLYAKMMTIVPILTGAMVVLVAGLQDRLLVMWMGKNIPEVAPILYLLILGTAFAVMLTGPGTCVCKGIGRVGIETIYLGANLFLNLLLTVLLVVLIGAIGTVIASGVSWAVTSILFVVILHKSIELPVGATYRAARAVLAVVATVALARLWLPYFPLGGNRLEATFLAAGLGVPTIVLFGAVLVCFRVISKAEIAGTIHWGKMRG